jgi:hypothetical protein
VVEVEWRLPLARFRICFLFRSFENGGLINLRPGGALRWKVETVGWKGRGVVGGEPTPSRLYPPPVSVKNRWVISREQVLNVLIACW